MPIVDIEVVSQSPDPVPEFAVASVASALGRVFGSGPGHTWVRMRILPASGYAENEVPVPGDSLPVFVTVLHARLPEGAALQAQVAAVTDAVAACLATPPERVHVTYAPAGSGRQAFGGRLA